MVMGVTPAELSVVVVALITSGVFAGFLAGLLGIGGGGVLVPVLYEVFRILDVDPSIRMHLTLGTSLAIIAPTALKSFSGHRAKGAVDIPVLVRMGPWIVAGVVVGILIANISSGTTLKWIWAIAASLFALKMALGREDWLSDPRFITAFEHPECMTIPANTGEGEELRPAVSGPVFSYDVNGRIHMRFSARKKNIRWRDDAITTAARAFLSEILNDKNGPALHYRLQAGEGLISNNVLHNRTAFSDGPGAHRHLYRARFFDRIET